MYALKVLEMRCCATDCIELTLTKHSVRRHKSVNPLYDVPESMTIKQGLLQTGEILGMHLPGLEMLPIFETGFVIEGTTAEGIRIMLRMSKALPSRE